MEYFSEIYGDSYRAVAEVLRRAMAAPLSEREISQIVGEYTSCDEALYITSRLTSGQWPLLRPDGQGSCTAVTGHAAGLPLTSLQKSWLAAILNDERCGAFLSDSQRSEIAASLAVPPLYDCSLVEPVGRCADSDRYSDPGYTQRLRIILDAIKSRTILNISYTGGKGGRIRGDFLPCRLEYSVKDEKLRLYAVRIRYGKVIFLATINLGRIDGIAGSMERFEATIDVERMRMQARRSEPAVVELVDRRNALERFMVQFASYEKRTRYIEIGRAHV